MFCRDILFIGRRLSFTFSYLCTNLSDNFSDECFLGTHKCDSNAACTVMHGSSTCACNSGYSGNGIICKGKQKVDVVVIF